MSTIFISSQNSTTGLNLFAPTSDTNVANFAKAIINTNSLSGNNLSNIIISVPTTDTTINLTSIGKIDLNNNIINDSSLWRIRNGSNVTRNYNLTGFNTTFSANYNALLANYDSYVVSPIVDDAATHILTDIITDTKYTKASLDTTALGPDLSVTTDNYNITGSSFNDTLTSAGGSDSLTGGLGSDILNLGVDTVQDSVLYNPTNIADAGVQNDLISNFVSGIDKIVLGGGLTLGAGGVTFLPFGSSTLLFNNGQGFAFVNGASLGAGDFIIV